MRQLLLIVFIFVIAGSATATELGNVQRIIKDNNHVGINPGTPDGREGGEDWLSAQVIDAIPFNDAGNTFDNTDDYDVACPYSGSTSPDAWYSFTPATDLMISVDLCGSGYDTKVYIIDGAINVIACNDDAYFDDVCGNYVSMIEGAELVSGTTYFIVIDGYGGDSGDYIMDIEEFVPDPPCVLECSGDAEGEPTLWGGYEDAYNGGCNSPEFGSPFQFLEDGWPCLDFGVINFCGIAGWTDAGRDTDWFYAIIGEYGMVDWTVDAEQLTSAYTLVGSCDNIAVDQSMTAGICAPGTMTIQGNPGDVIMLWIGASEFAPPAGFVGNEYDYEMRLSGVYSSAGATPTEKVTFDGIKSLYR